MSHKFYDSNGDVCFTRSYCLAIIVRKGLGIWQPTQYKYFGKNKSKVHPSASTAKLKRHFLMLHGILGAVMFYYSLYSFQFVHQLFIMQLNQNQPSVFSNIVSNVWRWVCFEGFLNQWKEWGLLFWRAFCLKCIPKLFCVQGKYNVFLFVLLFLSVCNSLGCICSHRLTL